MHPYFDLAWGTIFTIKLLILRALSTNRRRWMLKGALYKYLQYQCTHQCQNWRAAQSHTDKTNYAGRTIYQLSPLMIMLSRPGPAPPPAASITHTSPGTSSAPARATRTSWPACWPRAACHVCYVCRVCWWQTRVAACARYCDRGGAACPCHRAPRPARAR